MGVYSNVRTTAGTKLYVCADRPSEQKKTCYDLLDWVEVGEITEISDISKTFDIVEHNPIATRKTQKIKSSFDIGDLVLTVAFVQDDDGQVVAHNSIKTDNYISIKIVLQDNTTFYFYGKMNSSKKVIGSTSNIVSANLNLIINSEVIETYGFLLTINNWYSYYFEELCGY